ncbi:hypothetical protein [Microbacterium sp. T2.11-28]|uniref:hypothetical protein n=1 Tax=Microbacterium sp. T2.11-28 TaxID=3041169 RepID=UPI002477A2C4|nr:hypothetical protein [Microbacterium sp. T2.11-28]CAI9386066.1 hypothetical protein MICABA_00154 [Microbacterium sp. T2.11-28]
MAMFVTITEAVEVKNSFGSASTFVDGVEVDAQPLIRILSDDGLYTLEKARELIDALFGMIDDVEDAMDAESLLEDGMPH